MALFQKSVLKSHLSKLDDTPIDQSWETYQSYFLDSTKQKEILDKNEIQFQTLFLLNLFDKCLGYTLDSDKNSSQNLFPETKNQTDSKTADGAIKIDGEIVCVIELKSTKTKNLKDVEKQAFGYKVNHPNCKYVVTSNFNKLRFYIENTTEFEEFDLFNLTNDRFKLLWLCLSYDSISSNKPLNLKNESLVSEEKITKQLYKDYSDFRLKLFSDLKENNPQVTPEILLQKTQKLLDRMLFILFCEDRGLLPSNSITEIINYWDNKKEFGDDETLYDTYITYFDIINNGRPQRGNKQAIYPYNGGLFLEDEVLNGLVISDDLLLEYSKKLTAYDFDSEVSVNILGHIFEHSLTEIEELQNEIDGIEGDKSKSKRKKEGVFYTPQYITKYIVENTVGKLCEEKKIELNIVEEEYLKGRKGRPEKKLESLRDVLKEYRKWLLELTICDPACGSGAFLNQALEFLISEHNYIDELQNSLLGGGFMFPEVENSILENNLYGVDINKESVEIGKLSLWLRTAQKGRKLTSLNNNIKCGNSLIDDPEIVGDKAFKWENEFPEVFAKGGFDVVIGNPPYGINFDKKEKAYLTKFDEAVPDFEIYIYFISLFKKILKKDGVQSYIFPNTFLSILYGKKYRERIFNEITVDKIVDLSQDNTFIDASVRTIIFSFTNKESNYNTTLQKVNDKEFSFLDTYNKKEILKEIENVFSLFSQTKKEKLIINKIRNNQELNLFYDVSQGLIPYDKYRGHDEFTIKNRIWHSEIKKDETYKKELKGGDVTSYNLNWNGNLWISYGDWLAAPREPKYFNEPRVLVREITSNRLQCCFTTEEYYNTPSLINIIESEGSLHLKYLLSLLNSSLIGWYHNKTSPKANKGLFPKILVNDVRNIPIKKCTVEKQTFFIEKSELMINLNNKFQIEANNFTKYFQYQYSIEKLAKKLQNWHELDFSDFIKELNKAIKKQGGEKLTKIDEMEWMELFETKNSEAQSLKTEIYKTDKEIDQMIYELYGLTKEEIEIVENS